MYTVRFIAPTLWVDVPWLFTPWFQAATLVAVTFFFWEQRPQFVKNILENSSQSLGRRGSDQGMDSNQDSWDVGTPQGTRRRKNKR